MARKPNTELGGFCVLTNDSWATKLNDNNTVFQVELTALHEALISHLICQTTIPLKYADNRANIMASSNSKSKDQTTRQIFKILLTNPRIKVSWVKAHGKYRQ
ncbi:hypothetical protein AVEN_127793-1 [Araneus ventricosus]|uniref:RNase H type-1 domain-containing protein n=1 Tax=Araneus ventricosus TaxID=182803 RepID=A0A4Y2DQN6_ARAVE|nr:hypothetical protein AVEN_127793-1 [Araneus ventricosus]